MHRKTITQLLVLLCLAIANAQVYAQRDRLSIEQFLHLRVAGRPFGCGHKSVLVAADFTLVAGVPASVLVAPNLLAVVASTNMLSRHN